MSTDAEHSKQVRARVERARRDLGGEPAEGTFAYDLARLLERVERAERERDKWKLHYETQCHLSVGHERERDEAREKLAKAFQATRDPVNIITNVRAALAGTDAEPCPYPTPFVRYTEPTCDRQLGHEPPHRFVSLDGRTPLEVMPK